MLLVVSRDRLWAIWWRKGDPGENPEESLSQSLVVVRFAVRVEVRVEPLVRLVQVLVVGEL